MAPSPKETSPVLVLLWRETQMDEAPHQQECITCASASWVETFHYNAWVMLMNSTPPLKGIRKEKSPPSNSSELCTTERHTEKQENSVIYVNHMNHVMHVIQGEGHPFNTVLVGPGRRCTSTFRQWFFFTFPHGAPCKAVFPLLPEVWRHTTARH